MAQFAENLPRIAGGYIRRANVLDATGLDGAYDFTLNFGGAGMAGGRRERPERGWLAPGEASLKPRIPAARLPSSKQSIT
jgi:uncharacterized protein (TIGR03435 family)